MKFDWQRLNAEYAKQFDVESLSWLGVRLWVRGQFDQICSHSVSSLRAS